jgi:hypothetical protein
MGSRAGIPNKDKPFKSALLLEIKALGEGRPEGHPKGSLRWNAQRLLTKGEMSTIKEVADRVDGRVAYKMGGDEEGDPVRVIVRGVPRTGRDE